MALGVAAVEQVLDLLALVAQEREQDSHYGRSIAAALVAQAAAVMQLAIVAVAPNSVVPEFAMLRAPEQEVRELVELPQAHHKHFHHGYKECSVAQEQCLPGWHLQVDCGLEDDFVLQH